MTIDFPIFVALGPKLSTVCSLGTVCTGSWDGILCTGDTALDVGGADLFSSLRVHFHMAPHFRRATQMFATVAPVRRRGRGAEHHSVRSSPCPHLRASHLHKGQTRAVGPNDGRSRWDRANSSNAGKSISARSGQMFPKHLILEHPWLYTFHEGMRQWPCNRAPGGVR